MSDHKPFSYLKEEGPDEFSVFVKGLFVASGHKITMNALRFALNTEHEKVVQERVRPLVEALLWAKAFIACCEKYLPEQSERTIAKERRELIEKALSDFKEASNG